MKDRVKRIEKNLEAQPNNPLHGIRLDTILHELFVEYGWKGLADEFDFNCFKSNPTFKSSLKFLRKHPWARTKVESHYIRHFIDK